MSMERKSGLRVVVAGGGTGGHIYPALAIAESLQARYGAEIMYMGAKSGLHGETPREQTLAQDAGWPYAGVSAAGLSRRSLRILKDICVNLRGVSEAKEQLRRFKPQIVIGTGGFAMAPVLRAAASLNIPTLLHEQNAYPGWANRYLAKKVDTICLTFAAAKAYFPAKTHTVLTGLPVRRDIIEADKQAAWDFWGITGAEREQPTLLVTGGSQGAKAINDALCACYGQLLDAGLRIIHLTGETNIVACREAAENLRQENLHILPYLTEMRYALAAADMVVCRAGASFLAELAAKGLPAVLVPYPYAANDHQTRNAESFVLAGAAQMIKNADLTGETLSRAVLDLLADEPRRQRMAEASLGLAQNEAVDKILRAIEKLVKI